MNTILPWAPQWVAFLGGGILYIITQGKPSEIAKYVSFAGVLGILLHH
jgi:hypothetical protein